MEEFVDIKGYENKYFISNYGNIKNSKNKIFSPYRINSGYDCVKLWRHNKSKAFLVHRLVAEHFVENQDNKPNVDHIDSNRLNNRSSNLRWTTQKENVCNYKQNGLHKVGFDHPMCKFSLNDLVVIIGLYGKGFKRKDLASMYNCSKSTIDNIINKKYFDVCING